MENLMAVLPIILYIFGIILMIVLIIIGLRVLQLFDRTEKILDNVETKVNSLNGLFHVIDRTTGSIELIGTKIVDVISNTIGKLFKKKSEGYEDE